MAEEAKFLCYIRGKGRPWPAQKWLGAVGGSFTEKVTRDKLVDRVFTSVNFAADKASGFKKKARKGGGGGGGKAAEASSEETGGGDGEELTSVEDDNDDVSSSQSASNKGGGGAEHMRLGLRTKSAADLSRRDADEKESGGGRRREIVDVTKLNDETLTQLNNEHMSGEAALVMPGGGVMVDRRLGEMPHAPGLVLIRPIIYAVRDKVIAFTGYLSNVPEILKEFCQEKITYETKWGGLVRRQVKTPPTWVVVGSRHTLEAELVLRMYEHLNPENMLRFLRGRFAFALYDSTKMRLFAARDGSGSFPLYVGDDEDGGLYVINNLHISVAGVANFEEVAPGNFVLGVGKGLRQFVDQQKAFVRRISGSGRPATPPLNNPRVVKAPSAGERLNRLMHGLNYPSSTRLEREGDEDARSSITIDRNGAREGSSGSKSAV
ncbi:hypothetical protein CBR_g12491 [Chara braunii]|uniref:Glutamine amidotransferase type-2 domain-containing protein n=1 Tax=Chara braunii TaxID=69332 RepID=A0A388JSL2_CHABU|nr:hypothetical protein CBR_g12491 [Chara braunii]|eukprot:GBG60753.1 hypothetical protein CBR_g12491 [Chara braunii]